jgi:hypothetical protein
VGPIAGLDFWTREKVLSSAEIQTPERPPRSLVTVPITLCRLSLMSCPVYWFQRCGRSCCFHLQDGSDLCTRLQGVMGQQTVMWSPCLWIPTLTDFLIGVSFLATGVAFHLLQYLHWPYESSEAHWSLHVPPCLTFNNSPFCPHSVFMCFLWISEQTAIISLFCIN